MIDELELQPRSDATNEVQLNQKERRQYDELKRSLSYFFHSNDSNVDNTGSGTTVLQTITRLRQFCNHGLDLLPREIQASFKGLTDEKEMTRALMIGSQTCDSCDRQSSADARSKLIFRSIWCGHTICSRCLPEEQISHQSCPLCFNSEESEHISNDAQRPEPVDIHHRYQPSSKVLALLENFSAEQKVYPAVKR